MFRTEKITGIYDEKSLESFWAIVKTGRLTGAANFLDVTQPAISAAMKKIENKLDTKLIDRGGHRKIRLTDAGKRLYIYADKYFSDSLKNALTAKDILVQGETHVVGISSLLPPKAITDIMSAVNAVSEKLLDIQTVECRVFKTIDLVESFNSQETSLAILPNLDRDVCLSLNDDLVPLASLYEAVSAYTVDQNLNTACHGRLITTDDNFSLLGAVEVFEVSPTIVDSMPQVVSELMKSGTSALLTESQVADLSRYGVPLREISMNSEGAVQRDNFTFGYASQHSPILAHSIVSKLGAEKAIA